MIEGLENLANMEYPGRIIILGKDEKNENIVIYGITGRSPSSQARILESNSFSEGFYVRVKSTDEKTIKEGNEALLLYDAIRTFNNKDAIIVTNGAQTDIIFQELTHGNHRSPLSCLETALSKDWFVGRINVTQYEPDDPNFTPRISGAVFKNDAAFSIITKNKELTSKDYHQFIPSEGKGKLIATYTGVNEDPLPSFKGAPLDVTLKGNIEDITNNVYEALGEFKVSVACISSNQEYHIVNRHEVK